MDNKFQMIVDMVIKKSPLQKKKLLPYLEGRDATFHAEAEAFAVRYVSYLEKQGVPLEYAVDAYNEMCANMMKCQLKFMKSGRYPVDDHKTAYSEVYSNPERMRSYMIGLAISQFLWSTHYEMFSALGEWMKKYCPYASSYLEIGPGHGLFLNKAIEYLPETALVEVVDISPISIGISRSIMDHFWGDRRVIRYHNNDILKQEFHHKFDFITMGEVLEHVEMPATLLTQLRHLVAANGRVFISTCVNCPAIDHVYHFKFVQEIRDMLSDCGFIIDSERVLPVENLPMEEIVKSKITINYCSILKPKQS